MPHGTPSVPTEQRTYRIPKESKPAAVQGPPSTEAERQGCNSQSQKARGCFNPSPRDRIFQQTMSRFPVANHIFLGSWTVGICQECHSLRSAPQRRHTVHLGLCPCGAPRKQCLGLGRWIRHILIKLMKIKHKQWILKASREKQQITDKGIPIRITADFSTETLQAKREWQDILKSDEREKPTTKITLSSKDLFQIRRRNQKLYRQAKAERIQHHQTSSSTNAKGSSLDRKHSKVFYKVK